MLRIERLLENGHELQKGVIFCQPTKADKEVGHPLFVPGPPLPGESLGILIGDARQLTEAGIRELPAFFRHRFQEV